MEVLTVFSLGQFNRLVLDQPPIKYNSWTLRESVHDPIKIFTKKIPDSSQSSVKHVFMVIAKNILSLTEVQAL